MKITREPMPRREKHSICMVCREPATAERPLQLLTVCHFSQENPISYIMHSPCVDEWLLDLVKMELTLG